MILGINGIRLVRNRSGVARAIEAILVQLDRLAHPFDDVRVYTPEPLPADIRLPSMARNVVVRSALPPALWEQVALLRAHPAGAVLFCPSYTMPLASRSPTLVAHHGSYEGYTDRSEVFTWWKRTKSRIGYDLSANLATVVTTVSEYSRRDMARFYRLAPERIHVVPEGVDTALFHPIDDVALLSDWRRRVLGADRPFLLYVGKPTRRRNLPNLLRAYRDVRASGRIEHALVLIGTALPGTSFEGTIRELGIERDVVAVPHAPHAEVALAYNASAITLYPSSYEGFGMPVLEAMACGTPVIALDNTAFPEFAGGVACLLPDAEVATLARGIVELLEDEPRRRRMRVDGPRRAAAYDWSVVAGRYLELLVGLAGDRRGAVALRS